MHGRSRCYPGLWNSPLRRSGKNIRQPPTAFWLWHYFITGAGISQGQRTNINAPWPFWNVLGNLTITWYYSHSTTWQSFIIPGRNTPVPSPSCNV